MLISNKQLIILYVIAFCIAVFFKQFNLPLQVYIVFCGAVGAIIGLLLALIDERNKDE